MIVGGGVCPLSAPPVPSHFRRWKCLFQPVTCKLTKQGEHFLSALATAEDPTASVGLLRKFVASSSKHVALETLSHLLSPSTSRPHRRLRNLAFPLYLIIRQETWFIWNAKLVADLIASLYKLERFDEAENLFFETVSKLRFKERDLCMFYCHLVASHAKNKSIMGFLDLCAELSQFMFQSSSVYMKRRGYESLIGGFCEMGLSDRAESLIQEMKEMGLKPSRFEWRYLVYGYGQMGSLEDMKRCVVQMEKDGFDVDTVCCNMVLSSFGAQNELSDMLSWLKKMRSLNIVWSIRTYNSVLNSCQSVLLLLRDLKNVPLSIKELVDNLNKDEADLILELMKSSVLDQAMTWSSSELKLDLHGMHLSTVYLILLQWFDELKLRFDAGNHGTPSEILVVCGSGKHSVTRGESPVKGLVKEMTIRMKCPLRIDRKNTGCFITKGKVFKDWLCREDSNILP
ncbi:pentatricopeptide repeat-containing protein-like [Dorcoceras hygrometricum]|uniref:Pentatricopeptide repeat-containing protein-like n=1 Tax=Dorcoceras hygrometricum TaxID=472368 RepID=A0A2Z7DEJ7_9LAMI|nr:pentatricopeptide repeat-containing protein-like [Dorcoceras hygrometricum]